MLEFHRVTRCPTWAAEASPCAGTSMPCNPIVPEVPFGGELLSVISPLLPLGEVDDEGCAEARWCRTSRLSREVWVPPWRGRRRGVVPKHDADFDVCEGRSRHRTTSRRGCRTSRLSRHVVLGGMSWRGRRRGVVPKHDADFDVCEGRSRHRTTSRRGCRTSRLSRHVVLGGMSWRGRRRGFDQHVVDEKRQLH